MAKVWFSILIVVVTLSQVSKRSFLVHTFNKIVRIGKWILTQELTAANCKCGCSERTTYYYPRAERIPLPYDPNINDNQSNSVLLRRILSTLDAMLATEKIIAAAVSRPVWPRHNPTDRTGNKTDSTISTTNGTSTANTTGSPYIRIRRPYNTQWIFNIKFRLV